MPPTAAGVIKPPIGFGTTPTGTAVGIPESHIKPAVGFGAVTPKRTSRECEAAPKVLAWMESNVSPISILVSTARHCNLVLTSRRRRRRTKSANGRKNWLPSLPPSPSPSPPTGALRPLTLQLPLPLLQLLPPCPKPLRLLPILHVRPIPLSTTGCGVKTPA
jgi:hypothetical protein